MNDDLDPGLQVLFANAERELADNGFAERILAAAERQRRASRARWVVIGLAGLVAAWLLTAPLTQFAMLMGEGLTTALVPQGEGTLMQLLAPVNSVAGLLALALLAGQMLWRRIGG